MWSVKIRAVLATATLVVIAAGYQSINDDPENRGSCYDIIVSLMVASL